MAQRAGKVGDRGELIALLVDPPREPGEDGSLGGPGDREGRAGKKLGQGDGREGEADGAEERAQVAVQLRSEEERRQRPIRSSGDQGRPPFGAPLELRCRDRACQHTAQD